MSNNNIPREPFEGFDSPNYTQVPDELFDQLMPSLSDAELRVLLYIVRRTFGFKKSSDEISLSQMVEGITTGDGRVLDRGTGLSKATVARGLAALKNKGIIIAVRNRSAERGNEATTYRLRFKGEGLTPLVSAARQAPLSQQRDSPLSQQRDKQETVRQHTDNDLSKFEGSPDDVLTTHNAASMPHGSLAHLDSTVQDDSVPGRTIRDRRARHREASRTITDEDMTSEGLQGPPAAHRRPTQTLGDLEGREQLRAFLTDFAIELGDEAPISSTITRTHTIFTAAAIPAEQWGDYLYRARGLTQEHTAQIRKMATRGEAQLRRKNKMPYFLATLEQLVGLRPAPTSSVRGDRLRRGDEREAG